MTWARVRPTICLVFLGVLGCGGRSKSEDDAGVDGADEASTGGPSFAGPWAATRNECPNGLYTELRDATWSIRLGDATYTEVFSAGGCEATNALIPIDVQGNRARVDLSRGTQSCAPSPCQGKYTLTDSGAPSGVSYGILVCPKVIPDGRSVDIDWTDDALNYVVPGTSCVQRFVKRP